MKKTMKRLTTRSRKGSVLLYSVVLMFVLVVSGGAFMKWAADEAYQANLDLARTQAYYIAQQGAIEQGIGKLRNQKVYDLDAGSDFLPDGPEQDYGMYRGQYTDVEIYQDNALHQIEETDFVKSGAWDVTAVGHVEVPQGDGTLVKVSRRYTMRSQLRTFANYMYLSDIESVSPPDSSGDEVIWFYTGDTLYGRVHSNDYIGIKSSPVFYGPVSTSQDDFLRNGASAHFEYEPKFNVPEVYFPEHADDIRAGAAGQGHFYGDNDGDWLHKIVGGPSGWTWYRWAAGNGVEPSDDNVIAEGFITYSLNTIAFFEGRLYIEGDEIALKSSIGCGENMYLVNDVRYADVPQASPAIDPDSPNILGLIAENNIVIRNSFPNGRGNGGPGGWNANHNSAHIVITAGMVALGTSFTFEHQNDYAEAGNQDCTDDKTPQPATWDHGGYLYTEGNSDLRGYIFLRGALAQKRRGYVRRSNCGGTGYDKSYEYDYRLQTNPPPVYLAAEDEDGNVFFEVTSSWDGSVDDH